MSLQLQILQGTDFATFQDGEGVKVGEAAAADYLCIACQLASCEIRPETGTSPSPAA
jgi:hypothetical protein